jgi:integrase
MAMTPKTKTPTKPKSLTDLSAKHAKTGTNTIRIYDNSNDPLLKGFHLEILPSGTKTFKVAYTHPVSKQRKFFPLGHYSEGYKLKEAREDARKTRELLQNKIDPTEHSVRVAKEEQARLDAENKIGTVEKLFEYYIRDMELSKKRSAKTVKDLYNCDIKEFGVMRAMDVTSDTVTSIISKITARGSITKAKRVESYINAAFNFGKTIKNSTRWGSDSNLPDFRLEHFLPIKLKHEDYVNKTGERALSDDEVRILWKKIGVEAMSPDAALAIKFILATGQRVEEILNAPWTEFNLQHKEWVIPFHRRKNRWKNVSKEPHIVFLTDFHLSLLKEIKKLSGNSPFLFPNTRGNGCKTCDTLNQSVERFCKPTGRSKREPFPIFTPRDLRRTWKTRAGKHLGIDIRNRVQGHAFSDIGSKNYDRYAYENEKREAMQKWCNLLEEIINTPEEQKD